MTTFDYVVDLRAQAERRRLEAQLERNQAHLDLSSSENPPAVRVRIWEGLYGLKLPKDPEHVILAQISLRTGLHLDEIREIQRQRAAPPVAATP